MCVLTFWTLLESFVEIGWKMSDLGRKNWFSGFLDPQNDVIMRFGGSKIFFIKKFRPKYGGMQNLRKIVRAVLATLKIYWLAVFFENVLPLGIWYTPASWQENKQSKFLFHFISFNSKEISHILGWRLKAKGWRHRWEISFELNEMKWKRNFKVIFIKNWQQPTDFLSSFVKNG